MSHLPGIYSGLTGVKGSKVSIKCNTRNPLLRCARKEQVLMSNGPPETHQELELAKNELLKLVSTTSRGKNASPIERGLVAEAQASVEAFSPASIADWDLLQGTWDVVYSTAPDVVTLLQPPNGLPLRVGRISQRFSSVELGSVENIIELHMGAFAGNNEPVKVQCVVQADYRIRTARSISLTFKKAGFSGISFSQTAQDLLAPALLPRGWWNLALLVGLQQIQQAGIMFPLTPRPPNLNLPIGTRTHRSRGSSYEITYLDGDMLIGKAQASGGVFIFTKRLDDAELDDT